MQVQEHLINEDLYKVPVVMIKDNVKEKDKTKVKDIVEKRGGQITTTEDEATHVIHSKVELNNDLYCRPVFKRNDKCLVHFLYMPDSSDNWGVCYPETEPGDGPEEKAEQYHVSVDWVAESDQYNEWMNEEDYELDEAGKIKINEFNMTYDELETSEEKPDRKKKGKYFSNYCLITKHLNLHQAGRGRGRPVQPLVRGRARGDQRARNPGLRRRTRTT